MTNISNNGNDNLHDISNVERLREIISQMTKLSNVYALVEDCQNLNVD